MSTDVRIKPKPPKTVFLPLYKVLLHNDDINSANFVLKKVIEIGRLEEIDAIEKVKEAHTQGISLLLVTHKERAEFMVDQFKTYNITTTYEKD